MGAGIVIGFLVELLQGIFVELRDWLSCLNKSRMNVWLLPRGRLWEKKRKAKQNLDLDQLYFVSSGMIPTANRNSINL